MVNFDHFTQKLIAMFKNLLKFAFLFMIGTAIFTTGCTKDDPLPNPEPVKNPPTIEILTTGFYDTIVTTDTSNLFTLNIKADTGSIALKTFTIYNGGVKMALNNFRINGNMPSSNPILIVDATEKNGFAWDVAIRSQNTYDTQTYTLEVEDENGKKAEASIVIVVNEPVTTHPLDMELTDKMFYNNSGPMKGGIDLLDGSAQSTVSGSPHIKDNGLNTNGWAQTISPVGSVSMRSVDGATVYADIDTKEGITALWDAGTDVTTSAMLTGGEMFVAQVPDANGTITTVLFKITNVTVTANDNNDFYTVSIKY